MPHPLDRCTRCVNSQSFRSHRRGHLLGARRASALHYFSVLNIRPSPKRLRRHLLYFQAVIASGDTYAFDPQMSREDALAYWMRSDTQTYVAEEDREIVGTYILKPNQPGQGSHVGNAAFMVAPKAQRHGVGRAMGEHCWAKRPPCFRAMHSLSCFYDDRRCVLRSSFGNRRHIARSFRHPQRICGFHFMFRSLDAR